MAAPLLDDSPDDRDGPEVDLIVKETVHEVEQFMRMQRQRHHVEMPMGAELRVSSPDDDQVRVVQLAVAPASRAFAMEPVRGADEHGGLLLRLDRPHLPDHAEVVDGDHG
jgi:hypothetical protein